jgi:long-subunit acyl-CoA synthetase (AMP-forming)
MHPVIGAIGRHAAARPHSPALTDGTGAMSYAALNRSIAEAAAAVRSHASHPVALHLDNSPEWIVADLALLAARLPCVPLPGFFSPRQQAHAITDAGVEWLITDEPESCAEQLAATGLACAAGPELFIAGRRLARLRIAARAERALPGETVKVTYTSGTTGEPKGVCLGEGALAQVARSLSTACDLGQADRHLSVLPLATLLENVGVYASLSAGACCVIPRPEEIGVAGASGIDARRLLEAMSRNRATTAIVVPQMLRVLVEQIEGDAAVPPTLRFLAVGGAMVAPALLQRAATLGLRVYEGYGLSECASVVTLNTPRANRRGSAGRPLPHCALSFGRDGEILVSGATLLGYCGGDATPAGAWPTGDIGHLDDEGYLHITGRKRDCFITSFGRNVSPEWIESALTLEPSIAQAWAFGEARPWVAAVIAPRVGHDGEAVKAAVARVNRTLPDYARVRRWISAREPLTPGNGALTANGRLRRIELAARYRADIESLYHEESHELPC